VPGGKPITAEPGLKPKSPVITLGPVLVTVEPARTAKLSAVPRFTVVAALIIQARPNVIVTAITATIKILLNLFIYFI
jgi:hypothetical protein